MELTILVVSTVMLVVLVVVWTSVAWLLRLKKHEQKVEELRSKQLLAQLKQEYEDKLKKDKSSG